MLNRWRRWRVDEAFFSTLSLSLYHRRMPYACMHACIPAEAAAAEVVKAKELEVVGWREGEYGPPPGLERHFFQRGSRA